MKKNGTFKDSIRWSWEIDYASDKESDDEIYTSQDSECEFEQSNEVCESSHLEENGFVREKKKQFVKKKKMNEKVKTWSLCKSFGLLMEHELKFYGLQCRTKYLFS